jgi:hypothetical protein
VRVSAPRRRAREGGPRLDRRRLRRAARGANRSPRAVEATAQVAEEGVPPAQHPRPDGRLAPARRANAPLQVLAIPPDALPDRPAPLVQDAREHGGQRRWIRGRAVGGHLVRDDARRRDRAAEEGRRVRGRAPRAARRHRRRRPGPARRWPDSRRPACRRPWRRSRRRARCPRHGGGRDGRLRRTAGRTRAPGRRRSTRRSGCPARPGVRRHRRRCGGTAGTGARRGR